jgi:hypothetical protein
VSTVRASGPVSSAQAPATVSTVRASGPVSSAQALAEVATLNPSAFRDNAFRVFSLDLETTGFAVPSTRILEIAIVDVQTGRYYCCIAVQ